MAVDPPAPFHPGATRRIRTAVQVHVAVVIATTASSCFISNAIQQSQSIVRTKTNDLDNCVISCSRSSSNTICNNKNTSNTIQNMYCDTIQHTNETNNDYRNNDLRDKKDNEISTTAVVVDVDGSEDTNVSTKDCNTERTNHRHQNEPFWENDQIEADGGDVITVDVADSNYSNHKDYINKSTSNIPSIRNNTSQKNICPSTRTSTTRIVPNDPPTQLAIITESISTLPQPTTTVSNAETTVHSKHNHNSLDDTVFDKELCSFVVLCHPLDNYTKQTMSPKKNKTNNSSFIGNKDGSSDLSTHNDNNESDVEDDSFHYVLTLPSAKLNVYESWVSCAKRITSSSLSSWWQSSVDATTDTDCANQLVSHNHKTTDENDRTLENQQHQPETDFLSTSSSVKDTTVGVTENGTVNDMFHYEFLHAVNTINPENEEHVVTIIMIAQQQQQHHLPHQQLQERQHYPSQISLHPGRTGWQIVTWEDLAIITNSNWNRSTYQLSPVLEQLLAHHHQQRQKQEFKLTRSPIEAPAINEKNYNTSPRQLLLQPEDSTQQQQQQQQQQPIPRSPPTRSPQDP